MYRDKDQAIITAETFTAAHGLHQQQRQDVTFGKSSASRSEPYFASAIPAAIRLGEPGIGRISHRRAPQKNSRFRRLQTKGARTNCQHFTSGTVRLNAWWNLSHCSRLRQHQPAAVSLSSSIHQNSFCIAAPLSPAGYASDAKYLSHSAGGYGQDTRDGRRRRSTGLIAQFHASGVRSILVLRACRVLTCAVPVFYAVW